jgi:hypothetical protein
VNEVSRVAKFLLVKQTKNWEKYTKWQQERQFAIKYTEIAMKIPNGLKMHQK